MSATACAILSTGLFCAICKANTTIIHMTTRRYLLSPTAYSNVLVSISVIHFDYYMRTNCFGSWIEAKRTVSWLSNRLLNMWHCWFSHLITKFCETLLQFKRSSLKIQIQALRVTVFYVNRNYHHDAKQWRGYKPEIGL